MIAFFTQMLSVIAQFLISEPIIYFVGLVLLLAVVKVVKTIMGT